VTERSGGSRTLTFAIQLGLPPSAAGSEGTPRRAWNLIEISRRRDDWNGCCPGELRHMIWDRGDLAATITTPVSAADSYEFRIRRNGRTVTIERSDRDAGYTPVLTHTFGAQVDGVTQAVVFTNESFGESGAYADYDYVRLMRDTPGH
jgi:hypothetical protein